MTLIKVNNRGQTAAVLGKRNLVRNGAMKVAQRGTLTGQTSQAYQACDGFAWTASGGAITSSQDTNVPTGQGFKNSLKIDVTTADTSIAAGDYGILFTRMEGQDLQHLLYGTSSAKKLTVQFWVSSPKTGIHIVELNNLDASYQNAIQYTISSANTWEKKTVTFDGYQTSAFDNDSNGSLQLGWWLYAGTTYGGGTHNSNTWHNTAANRAVGQVNVLDNTANNFYLTGVQMEVSDSDSEFEHRSFGEELALCQRYYYKLSSNSSTDHAAVANGYRNTTSSFTGLVHFPVHMRTSPTAMETSGTASHFDIRNNNGTLQASSGVPAFRRGNVWGSSFTFAVAVGGDAGGGTQMRFRHEDGYLAWSAEL